MKGDEVQDAAESDVSSTAALAQELRTQVERTADWLNSRPLDQLARAAAGGSIADQAYSASVAMVRNTEELREMAPRDLPQLASHGVGAQLAVVGEELAVAAEAAPSSVHTDLMLIARVNDILALRTTR